MKKEVAVIGLGRFGGSIVMELSEMNADVLVNQVCDENLDYLDLNPDIKKAIEYYNEMHPEEAAAEENDDKGNDADN